MKKISLNAVNTDDCPCRECTEERYVGCHSKCLKYIDWKQQHDVKLQNLHKQKDMNSLLYNNQTSRNKKLRQEGGIHYGRRSDDSR